MAKAIFEKLVGYRKLPEDEMKKRAAEFYALMRRRRTVRNFSDQPVDKDILEYCLKVASSAPSGANQQPWRFVVVSDPDKKKAIRRAAEKVENEFYSKEAAKKVLVISSTSELVPKNIFWK